MSVNRWGWTPLMYATAQMGRMSIVQLLQRKGADVNMSIPCGASPLTFAAENLEFQVCQYLIQCGADCSKAGGQFEDLLSWASAQGDLVMVKQLVVAGAQLNSDDADAHPPLYIAAENGHKDIC